MAASVLQCTFCLPVRSYCIASECVVNKSGVCNNMSTFVSAVQFLLTEAGSDGIIMPATFPQFFTMFLIILSD